MNVIAFCLVSSNHGPMIVNRLDQGNGEYGVGYQILTNGGYDQEDVDFLKSLLSICRDERGDGVVAIDCGANIGVHSLEWSRHMRGWGAVIAIEAQERLFYALAGNLALQNCSNVRAIWGAVDMLCGEIIVPEPDYEQASSFGSLELKPRHDVEYIGQAIDYEEPTLRVKTLSIDSLNLSRVDLIKLDVEGMELAALDGAKTTIARCRPLMFIETIKIDADELAKFLDGIGYSVMRKMGINVLACRSEVAK